MTEAEAICVTRQAGPSSIDFHPNSLISFARALSRSVAFELAAVGDGRVVAPPASVGTLRDVVRRARRLAHASGATSLERLHEALSETASREYTPVRLRNQIRAFTSAVFLDAEEEWFCFPNDHDTVATTTLKMLSVTSPLSIDEIRDGVRKVLRFRESSQGDRGTDRFPPSREILALFLASNSKFVVSGELVARARPKQSGEVLALSERALLQAFEDGDNSIHRARAIDYMLAAGFSVGTATTMLTYSPLVQRVGPDTWCLVGRRAQVGAVSPARTRRGRNRIVDFGWSSSGELYLQFRVPDPRTSPTNGIHAPSTARPYLPEGEYAALTADGISSGMVTVAARGRLAGFGRFFRLAGVEPGDIVEVRFSISSKTARLLLVDDQLA